MIVVSYNDVIDLKRSIGQRLRFVEVNVFSTNYQENGPVYVVGPLPLKREYAAKVEMVGGKIASVTEIQKEMIHVDNRPGKINRIC